MTRTKPVAIALMAAAMMTAASPASSRALETALPTFGPPLSPLLGASGQAPGQPVRCTLPSIGTSDGKIEVITRTAQDCTMAGGSVR